MKNLSRYNDELSIPRKRDLDTKQDRIDVTTADNGKIMKVVNGKWVASSNRALIATDDGTGNIILLTNGDLVAADDGFGNIVIS